MDKIKVREVKYDKIDEVLEKFIESGEFEEDLIDFEIKDGEAFGEDLVILSSPAWRVTDKGLIFVEGTYFSLQNGQYEPDWSITMVYEDVSDDELDLSKFIYFEQGSPASAVHNCLTMMNM